MRLSVRIVLVFMGLAIAVATLFGLVNVTPRGLTGATWYGWPFAWRYVIVYPGSPVHYDFMNFFFDIIAWFILITAIWGILSLISPSTTK